MLHGIDNWYLCLTELTQSENTNEENIKSRIPILWSDQFDLVVMGQRYNILSSPATQHGNSSDVALLLEYSWSWASFKFRTIIMYNDYSSKRNTKHESHESS
jgi:hypothetical protein